MISCLIIIISIYNSPYRFDKAHIDDELFGVLYQNDNYIFLRPLNSPEFDQSVAIYRIDNLSNNIVSSLPKTDYQFIINKYSY